MQDTHLSLNSLLVWSFWSDGLLWDICVCVCVGRWVGGVGLKVKIVMRSFIIEHLIILKHDYSQ